MPKLTNIRYEVLKVPFVNFWRWLHLPILAPLRGIANINWELEGLQNFFWAIDQTLLFILIKVEYRNTIIKKSYLQRIGVLVHPCLRMEFFQLASDNSYGNNKSWIEKYNNTVSVSIPNQDELRYVDWVVENRETHTNRDHSFILKAKSWNFH